MLNLPRDTCQYVLSGTETFRLASRALAKNKHIGFKGYGGNQQNKSDKIRRIYIPDDGKVLVQVDQAGAEALVVAYLTRPGKFRDLFLNGIKSHTFIAMHLFDTYWQQNGIPEVMEIKDLPIPELGALKRFKEISKIIKNGYGGVYYFIGKKTCHAYNYEMRENTFVTDVLKESSGKVRLSLAQGAKFLNKNGALFPEIREWQLGTEQELSRTHILRNLFGYPREFTGAWTDGLIREAVAFRPQSTVGTITNKAITRMQEFIETEKVDWDILGNCHDSYLLQCPNSPESIKACVLKSKEFMEQKLTSPRGETFYMKSEAGVGGNWGKWDEKDNPQGMKEFAV